MPVGPQDVINMALGYLGFETITSLEDDSLPQATVAKAIWPTCRDAFLQEYPWSFAKREARLAVLAEKPATWGYAYSLPDDFIRVYRVYTISGYHINDPDFDIMQTAENVRALCAHLPGVVLEYGSNRTELNSFSPLAIDALAHRLAFMIGQSMKAVPQEQNELYQVYMTARQAAAAADAANRSYKRLQATSFNRSRQLGVLSRTYFGRGDW